MKISNIAIISPYITTSFGDEQFYNIQAFGLAKELVKRGINVDIYTGIREKKGLEKKFFVGDRYFKIKYLPVMFEFFGQIPILRGLIHEIKQNNYDIVQIHEDFQFTTIQIVMNRNSINTKKLVLYLGAYAYSSNFFFKTFNIIYDNTFGKIVKNRVDIVFAKTTMAEIFARNKEYRNVSTLHIGTDTEMFQPRDITNFRKKYKIPDDIHILLYIGSFEKRRNILLIIEIINKLKRKLPVRLIMIGDGPLKKDIYGMVDKYELSNQVIILDKIANKDLSFIYSAADLFMLLSEYEVFGMVLLESMACGTPVISTDTAGAKDIIKDMENGYIISIDNAEKISEKLIIILSDKELLKNIGKNARKTIVDNFDWGKIAEKYLAAMNL